MIGANKKKKVSEFATPYTVGNALTKGGATVKLSALVMGLANMAHKQIIKGLIFLAIEIAYIAYMVSAGAYYISMLPSLGWRKITVIWRHNNCHHSIIYLHVVREFKERI